MLDPKQIADFDQAIVGLGEMLPAAWWKIYQGCKASGFTDEQALRLTIAFIQRPQGPI